MLMQYKQRPIPCIHPVVTKKSDPSTHEGSPFYVWGYLMNSSAKFTACHFRNTRHNLSGNLINLFIRHGFVKRL